MMTDTLNPAPPDAIEVSDALATRMMEALEGLPFAAVLDIWNQLVWWITVWPLFKHLATIELTLPETFVLRMLVMKPLNVSDVAQMLGLSHSSASRSIDRLVAAAFVSRDEDPEDRRQKRLALTATGEAKVREIEAVFGAEFSALVDGLSRDEQETLQHLLSRLVAASIIAPDAPPERVAWGQAFVAASPVADCHQSSDFEVRDTR